jgi:hemoglobin-like flavoprotein
VVTNPYNAELLVTTCKNLGARLVSYGVLPKHSHLMGNLLIKTLESLSENTWTSKFKQALVKAYIVITTLCGQEQII